jgi:lysozyme family protein
MADFAPAVIVILKHEGGLVDNPADPGGCTNYGISLRWYLTVNPSATASDIESMSQATAADLYQQYWWNKFGYGQINDQTVATKIFDMSVNMGDHQAHMLVQRACNDCGLSLQVDGVLGSGSLGAINSNPPGLLAAIINQQVGFYTRLAAQRPTLSQFLPGWLKRANWPNS